MNEQEKIIELIKNADISVQDWDYEILEKIENKYMKGYLTAKLERLWDNLLTDNEDFRMEFLYLITSMGSWGEDE